jgi:hypothetical protein
MDNLHTPSETVTQAPDMDAYIESVDIPTFPDALPQIIEENGRVVRVIFPRYVKPPTGVDMRQIQLLQDASDYDILRKIRPEGARRAIRYYGTNDFATTIAKDEGVHPDTVYSSINSVMRKVHRFLSQVNSDLVNERYPNLDEIAVTKNRSEFTSERMRNVWSLAKQASKGQL